MLTKASLADFKLKEGSMREQSTVHNGGWYASDGTKIGWGDLAPADFKTIQNKLKPSESFVVLSEQDSFWTFVTRIGMTGALSKVKPEEKNPGQNYIAEKARWIITSTDIYFVGQLYADYDYGFECKALSRKEANKLIKKSA